MNFRGLHIGQLDPSAPVGGQSEFYPNIGATSQLICPHYEVP